MTGLGPTSHRIDAALPGVIVGTGSPLATAHRRIDGAPKVTGAAVFAGEETPRGTLHGVIVGSPVARGRLAGIDATAALRVPGVVRVLTGADLPPLGPPMVPPFATASVPMTDDRIRHEGQPVAIVLAETLEAAEEAAGLLRLSILREPPTVFETGSSRPPRTQGNGYAFAEIDQESGDVDAGLPRAAATIDATYLAPTRHHNMMESPATLAEWRGAELHIHTASQWTFGVRYALAGLLQMPPAAIHVRCPYTGGGFGAKGYVWPHQLLAVLAARVAGRPVKIVLGRDACYTGSGYQPVVRSRMRLGADAEGRLMAVEHVSENVSSTADDYIEFGSAGTRSMYACPSIRVRTRIVPADVPTPTAMRAPHEGPGMFALESAMDELAERLRIDPLELRLRNHADVEPIGGKPFSSKKLREAYAEGARRFGWAGRDPTPRARREGRRLVGTGMASAIMSTFRFASTARVRLAADGTVRVEAGSQEIGTGTRTILAGIAAERLGLPIERVTTALGATDLPETGGTFGSSTTMSAGSAVADAADRLKARLGELAGGAVPPPADWPSLLARRGVAELVADGAFQLPGGVPFDAHGGAGPHAMHTWGAVFVEMEVDEELGVARMRRAVGCYSAGRILNPATARSQMIGGIIWGYGRAMLEESAMDARHGRFVSKNLSGVHLPVNADIPRDIDVSFIAEDDPHASLIGVRGIGELCEVGVAAAIANAVHHATGRRVRELPIKFADLLG
jgi:xanthine dehydrogenase YagR molybdenum-binding subunit